MAQVPVYNDEGKRIGEAAIAERVAGRQPHPQLIHDYVVAAQANRRQWSANTRERSEIRGSTSKPWRQKGTGRARAGSLKSPLFRGGGTIFGPKPKGKSARVALPKKVRRLALETALADKLRAGHLIVLDTFEVPEPRTKLVAALLKALKLDGKVLLVPATIDGNLRLSARNIATLVLKAARNVCAIDVLRAGTVVLLRESLDPMDLVGKVEEGAA